MPIPHLLFGTLLALATSAVAAYGGNPDGNGANDPAERGHKLHEAQCQDCHGTGVYTREDRKITSLGQLKAQVQRCAGNAAKADWNALQVQAVTDYLNQEFYHF